MVKMNKTYLDISSFIVCVFPIITLIFSVRYTNTPYLTGILTELNNALNDYPLNELEYNESCTKNQFTQTLFKIPESVEGCSCVNVQEYSYKQSNKSIVFRGKCKKNHTLNGCITISSYPSVNINKWRSKKFCSKKYNKNILGYKYFFKNSVGENENCKAGYKKCGKLDDMGNDLCMPEKDPCPINDIIISNEALNNSNITYKMFKMEDKYIYFTNKSNNPIITKLKTAEGKLCAGKGYYHTDYPQFILDSNFDKYGCRFKINGSIFDESIIKLDRMKKYELYDYNNFSMYSRYNDSCEYPYYNLNEEIFLYVKRFIGFNKQCLKVNNLDIDSTLFDDKTINKINESLLKNRMQHRILIWISIAAIDFYFMTCFFISIDKENNLNNFYIWCIITIPFYLAMTIVSIIGLVAMVNIKTYPLCNDSYTNSKLALFNTKSRKIILNTLALVFIINGQLLLTIILYILKRRKVLRNSNNIISSDSQVLSSVNTVSQSSRLISQAS